MPDKESIIETARLHWHTFQWTTELQSVFSMRTRNSKWQMECKIKINQLCILKRLKRSNDATVGRWSNDEMLTLHANCYCSKLCIASTHSIHPIYSLGARQCVVTTYAIIVDFAVVVVPKLILIVCARIDFIFHYFTHIWIDVTARAADPYSAWVR